MFILYSWKFLTRFFIPLQFFTLLQDTIEFGLQLIIISILGTNIGRAKSDNGGSQILFNNSRRSTTNLVTDLSFPSNSFISVEHHSMKWTYSWTLRFRLRLTHVQKLLNHYILNFFNAICVCHLKNCYIVFEVLRKYIIKLYLNKISEICTRKADLFVYQWLCSFWVRL